MAHYNNGWDRFQNSLALIFITAKAGRLEEAHAEFDAFFAPYQHPPRAIERPKRLLDEAGEEPFPTLAPKPPSFASRHLFADAKCPQAQPDWPPLDLR